MSDIAFKLDNMDGGILKVKHRDRIVNGKEKDKLTYLHITRLEKQTVELGEEVARLRALNEALTENLEEAQTELNQNAQAFKKLREHIQCGVKNIDSILRDK